jgi:ABC-type sugar transport system permease subunit
VFVSPFVALFAVFTIYPLARSLVLSFHASTGPRQHVFVGLDNYEFLLTDTLFWKALVNTLVYAVLFVSLHIPASLGLALLLSSASVRLRAVFRFAFFSSYLVGHVFVAVIFMALLAPRHGLINRALAAAVPWLDADLNWRGDSSLAMPAVVLATLWLSIGYGMIYFLAALQQVDRNLYGAAAIDGAGRWARLRHVTLPAIKPVTTFLVLVGTIGALQLFEVPYVLLEGAGPGFAGLTIVMYLYQQGFETGNIGYASAIGWILALVIALIAAAQLTVTGARRE